MFKTTRGLVLREVRYKEADRILTVLTEDMGRITVKARGALRKSSRTGAATQLFAFSELTMFENKGKWSVNEGSTIEEFKGLRDDISALALASYFAECAEALSDEDRPDPELLRLILNSFYALSGSMYPQRQIKTAFELKLAAIAGYEPDIAACAVCGNEPQDPYFSVLNGVVCCRKCRNAELSANIALCDNSLKVMRYILGSDMRRMLAYSVPDDAAERASNASESYLAAQTERRFQTLAYWKQVK